MTHILPLSLKKPIAGFITAKETYMQIMFLHWGKRTVFSTVSTNLVAGMNGCRQTLNEHGKGGYHVNAQ